VLYDAAEAVRIAAVLLLPVMPASATEILRRMGETTAATDLRLDTATTWRASGERDILNAGALWPRLEDKGAITVSETTPPAAGPEVAAPRTQRRSTRRGRPHRLADGGDGRRGAAAGRPRPPKGPRSSPSTTS
jgi:hypothetical protein